MIRGREAAGVYGKQHGMTNIRASPFAFKLPTCQSARMATRLAAWPLRGKPCGHRAYHRPRGSHLGTDLLSFSSPYFSSSSSSSPLHPSFFSSSSSSSFSPSPHFSPGSFSSVGYPPVRILRRFTTACGVKCRGCRAPLLVRSNPLQGFRVQDYRALYSTRSTMTATKIDGTAIAKSIRDSLKSEIEQIQQSNPRFIPSLVIFQSGCS